MNLSDSHKKILNFLESEGPHTADETQEKLGHDFHQTNSALFSKLEKEGLIEPVLKSDGTILKRNTRLNREIVMAEGSENIRRLEREYFRSR
jgi:predicted transcriptional regulator